MYGKNDTPVEIAALIGQKYTFIVKISSKKSFASNDPSFEVLYITHQFGKETTITSSGKQEQSSTILLSTNQLQGMYHHWFQSNTKLIQNRYTQTSDFFLMILSFCFQKKILHLLIVYLMPTYRMQFQWYKSLKQILTPWK